MSYSAHTPPVIMRAAINRTGPTPPIGDTTLTRATPNLAYAQAGLISTEPQKVWGRLPLIAVEGHEPDRAWDIRSNPDGLTGIQRGNPQAADPSAGLFRSNSGLTGIPIGTSQNLERLLQLIKDGKADWRQAGNYFEAARGDAFSGLLKYAQNAANSGDYTKANQLIVKLYWQIVPWREKAALANIGGASQTTPAGVEAAWRAEGIDPLKTATSRITSSITESLGISELPSWALPAAAGALLFLLLRR